MKAYYDRRAREYDDWWDGTGTHAEKPRPGWALEVKQLLGVLERLVPAHVLDVACGTGFLTRRLRGVVVGLDQSEEMLRIARERAPSARFIRGEALELPFEDGAFERVLTAHFYGHLDADERTRFLREARRVGTELVVVDSAMRDGEGEAMQERVLEDGSRWTVLKRYFEGRELAAELGGGEVLLDGNWFVVVRA